MNIKDIQIEFCQMPTRHFLALAHVTFDNGVIIDDFRIVQGDTELFVGLPDKKNMKKCTSCKYKNPLGSVYCNQCGDFVDDEEDANQRLYKPMVRFTHFAAKKTLTDAILEAYAFAVNGYHGSADPQLLRKEVPHSRTVLV